MSVELYFNDELRKCLNAVGLSDCGENDQWNYWYQRLHRAHDATVDRVTEVQRAENAQLRERITTQKQTIQSYRDESREWREAAEHAQADNAKLRELCAGIWNVMWACAEQRCQYRDNECFVVNGNNGGHKGCGKCWYKTRMRELGIEADE